MLLDLAQGIEDVVDALEIINERLRNADQLVPPSVLDELVYFADSGQTPVVRQSARLALKQLRGARRFRPILELPFAPQQADELARRLRSGGLLPADEVHDSRILAETALLNCGILLSSDEHLRGIDHQQLTWILNPYDLAPPIIATPVEIVRKFFR